MCLFCALVCIVLSNQQLRDVLLSSIAQCHPCFMSLFLPLSFSLSLYLFLSLSLSFFPFFPLSFIPFFLFSSLSPSSSFSLHRIPFGMKMATLSPKKVIVSSVSSISPSATHAVLMLHDPQEFYGPLLTFLSTMTNLTLQAECETVHSKIVIEKLPPTHSPHNWR
jgi:hypothetical protein